jgi:glycosyltransferase involved in cell wall biosynthesis
MRSVDGSLINDALSNAAGGQAVGWPRRIGILNDYVRIPYANGSSFASQFLYREFRARGHRVTVIGPEDPAAMPGDLPERSVSLKSVPLRNHPGVHLALPTPSRLKDLAGEQLDVVLGQTGSAMMEAGIWLRAARRVPFISVNTIHLPSVYNVVLPEALLRTRASALFRERIVPWTEAQAADAYNQGDGLIVLSEGLKRYWRERGVRVPIHVIPRAVDPAIFDQPALADPFPAAAKRGARLLVVCRMTREKGVSELIEIFAKFVAPVVRDATLTLVGDGPDLETFLAQAQRLHVEHRVFFAGEQRLTAIPAFLRYADLFVYTSLSETYGQVVSEAQWCGAPVVALADGMGVSQQVEDGKTGILIDPHGDPEQVKWRFAKAVLLLLHNPQEREALSRQAAERVRQRARPEPCIQRYYEAFEVAREHCLASAPQDRAAAYARARSVTRWTAMHVALAGIGLVRPPAHVNRAKCRQPSWDSRAPLAPAGRRISGFPAGDALAPVEAASTWP